MHAHMIHIKKNQHYYVSINNLKSIQNLHTLKPINKHKKMEMK